MIAPSTILALSVIFFVGCQSFRKQEAVIAPPPGSAIAGQWEAKAMIKSLETGEASVVNLDVLAQKPQPMRVEVSTSLGIALASILIKAEEIEYIVPKQKKYYHGPISDQALFPILKIKVDPKLLWAAFFEEPYPDWNCKAENGLIQTCETPDGVRLKWDREESVTKRVLISSSTYDVQVQIKKFIAKSSLPGSATVLKVPEAYKKYKTK
jgi:hypothetical protein